MNRIARLAILIAVPAVLSWLLRKRTPIVATTDGSCRIAYGRGFRAVPWVIGVALVVLFTIVGMTSTPEPGDGWIIAGLVVGFGSLIGLLANEVRRTYVVDGQGITLHSAWRRSPVRREWSDLEEVCFAASAQAIELRFRTSRRLRLSQYLDGLGSAMEVIAQVIGREQIPPVVLAVAGATNASRFRNR